MRNVCEIVTSSIINGYDEYVSIYILRLLIVIKIEKEKIKKYIYIHAGIHIFDALYIDKFLNIYLKIDHRR